MASAERRSREVPAQILGPRIVLLLTVLALLLLGLVMVYSSSTVEAISEGASTTSYLVDQLSFAVIGIAAAFIVWKFIPCRLWRGALVWVVWGIAMALLIATAAFGTTELGATRWLSIGPISLQPSEFAKIALVLMAARMLDDYRNHRISTKMLFLQAIVLLLLPVMLIYKFQSDLGTTVICVIGILAVLWMAEVPLGVIFLYLGVVIVFGVIAIFGSDYRAERFIYLDPWSDEYGEGWQIIHSFYAFAEGGIFGVGIGNSSEKYLYLPEAETDFVYAIVGEELGLVGSVGVIVLFMLLLWAGMRIARTAADNFGAMIAGSLTIMIVFQAFLNIGCVIGLFPTTGKPLPFLSSGGSSLIATLIMIGLILSVSKEAAEPSVYERRRENLRIVRATGGEEGEERRGGSGSASGHPGRRGGASPSYRAFQTARPARSPSAARPRGGRGRIGNQEARTCS